MEIEIPLSQYHICTERCAMTYKSVECNDSTDTSQDGDTGNSIVTELAEIFSRLNGAKSESENNTNNNETKNENEPQAGIISPSFKCCMLTLVPNESYIDGKCDEYMTIENPFISVKRRNYENVIGLDEIVIRDTHIRMKFYYPLKDEFVFEFQNENGFNRKNIIDCICDTYEYIYAAEEASASKHKYKFKSRCDKCAFVLNSTSVFAKDQRDSDQCSICCEELKVAVRLPLCRHEFHDECIKEWFDRDNITCPVCRKENRKEECDE